MTSLNTVLNASPTDEPAPGTTAAVRGPGLRITPLDDTPGLRIAGDLDHRAITALSVAPLRRLWQLARARRRAGWVL